MFLLLSCLTASHGHFVEDDWCKVNVAPEILCLHGRRCRR